MGSRPEFLVSVAPSVSKRVNVVRARPSRRFVESSVFCAAKNLISQEQVDSRDADKRLGLRPRTAMSLKEWLARQSPETPAGLSTAKSPYHDHHHEDNRHFGAIARNKTTDQVPAIIPPEFLCNNHNNRSY